MRTVKLPDGTLVDNVPDEFTDAQVIEKVSGMSAAAAPQASTGPRSVTLPDGTIVDNVPANVTDKDVMRRSEVYGAGKWAAEGLAGIDGPVADPVKQFGLGTVDSVAGPVSAGLSSDSVLNALPGMKMFDRLNRGIGKMVNGDTQGFKGAGQDLAMLNQQVQSGNKPTTEAGKWTRAIGKEAIFTPLGVGSLPSKIAQSVGAGAAAETANRYTNNNPLAEALASMIGGGVVAGVDKALIGNPSHILRDAADGLTPKNFADARAKSELLKKEGISHTSAQLLDTPTMSSIFNEVSQHPKVAAGIHKQFEGVPGQVTSSIERKMDLELGVPGTTRDTLSNTQAAAAAALKDEMKRASGAYGAAKSKALTGAAPTSPTDVMAVSDQLTALGAKHPAGSSMQALIDDVRYMLFRERLPVTDQSRLDSLMTGVDPNPTFRPGNAVTDKEILANINPELNAKISAGKFNREDVTLNELKKIVADLVPEMKSVNSSHAQVFDDTLSPMNKSLTGRVGKFGGGPQEMKETASEGLLNQIFPGNVNQAEQIVGMGQDMRTLAGRTQNPDTKFQAQTAIAGALREKMNQSLNQSNKPVGGFPNANIGGDFVSHVYSNPAQKANVQAAVSEAVLAQGKRPEVAARAVEGFDNLLEALNTFSRVNLVPGANPYELGKQMSENVASKAIAPFSAYSQKMQTIARARNAKELANILSTPSGLEMLEEFARLGPSPGFGEALAGSALRGAGKMYTAE